MPFSTVPKVAASVIKDHECPRWQILAPQPHGSESAVVSRLRSRAWLPRWKTGPFSELCYWDRSGLWSLWNSCSFFKVVFPF